MREQKAVGSYYRLAPRKRMDLIVYNIDSFPAMIRDYEMNVEEWLLSRRSAARQEALSDLGVRVTGGFNAASPTENAAFEKMWVENIIKTGKPDDLFYRLPDHEEIERALMEIRLMRREYDRLKNRIRFLRADEKSVFERYIRYQDRTAELSDELSITQESVRKKIYRIKKKLYAGFADSLDVYDDESILLLAEM